MSFCIVDFVEGGKKNTVSFFFLGNLLILIIVIEVGDGEGCREEAYIWSLNRAKFRFLYYKQFLYNRCGMGLCVYCLFYKFQFLRYKT
jgi:hypothetical protein